MMTEGESTYADGYSVLFSQTFVLLFALEVRRYLSCLSVDLLPSTATTTSRAELAPLITHRTTHSRAFFIRLMYGIDLDAEAYLFSFQQILGQFLIHIRLVQREQDARLETVQLYQHPFPEFRQRRDFTSETLFPPPRRPMTTRARDMATALVGLVVLNDTCSADTVKPATAARNPMGRL